MFNVRIVYVPRFCRAPSLFPVQVRFVDDLLAGQKRGYECVDSSRNEGDPERYFRLKVILLLWVGDYPGQAKMSGFSHASTGLRQCHWCKHRTPIYLPSRALFLDNFKHLPTYHSLRPVAALLDTFEARTHEASLEDMAASEAFPGTSFERRERKGFPGKESGVNEWMPLNLLHLWDSVKDSAYDGMHNLENILKKHILPLIAGAQKKTSTRCNIGPIQQTVAGKSEKMPRKDGETVQEKKTRETHNAAREKAIRTYQTHTERRQLALTVH
jgi:hypothetical protein